MKDYIINKIKNIMSKGAHYVIMGNFMTKFVSFFGSVFLVRFLSKTDYGILSYYENIYGYFLLTSGLGLGIGILRYIVIADNHEKKKTLFCYSIKRGQLYNFFLIVIFSLICLLFPHQESFSNYYFVGIILVLIIPFQYLLTLNLSTLRGLFDYKSFALISILTSILLVFVRVLGAKLYGLYGTVTFRLIGEIICSFCSVYYIYNRFFKNTIADKMTDLFKPLNLYSIQIMFTDGLWALFMLNDVFMLGQLTGSASQIADYKTAYVIPANLSLISSAIGMFVSPFFTKKDYEGNRSWVKEYLLKLEIAVFGITLSAVIFCLFFSHTIVSMLFGIQYLSCIPIYNVLLLSSLVNNGIRYTFANVYSAIGLQKINLIVAAIGVLFQIAINSFLIPKYGSIGVAYGSVFVQIVMSIILILYIKKI